MSDRPFDLLRRDLRKYVYEKKWPELRKVQGAAIENIIKTKDNFSLVAKTASGKTEAAFLPTISLVDDWSDSVKIVYISPLVALINDQFFRIEDLCRYSDILITKWHGDASPAAKKRLLKNPQGILLITPESLEAFFVCRPGSLKKLFSDLDFIIIDEIHSFLGTDRGRHLQSLVHRLTSFSKKETRMVSLSATVNEKSFPAIKNFYNLPGQTTKIIRDNSQNEVFQKVDYFETAAAGSLPPELVDEIYKITKKSKSLIFPNSRSLVEEVAVGLKKRAEKFKDSHQNYYAHHSSIDKNIREEVEQEAKRMQKENFAICCTSTLELGIDIGTINTVVQINSTFSVASLVQRLGRSGRQSGQSNLAIYATEPWSLLKSIACVELYKEGFVEPIRDNGQAYNVLAHQILSTVSQHSSISTQGVTDILSENPVFLEISQQEKEEIIDHLLKTDILEKVEGELIIGLEGEKIVKKLSFYGLFQVSFGLRVFYKDKKIGEIHENPETIKGENILLAARIWRIVSVEEGARKVYVEPAPAGRPPAFYGSGGQTSQEVYDKISKIAKNDEDYDYLSQRAREQLKDIRQGYVFLRRNPSVNYRPIILQEGDKSKDNLQWHLFAADTVFKTIFTFLEHHHELDISQSENKLSIKIEKNKNRSLDVYNSIISLAKKGISEDVFAQILEKMILEKSQVGEQKFANLLPIKKRAQLLMARNFDIPATNNFLKKSEIELLDKDVLFEYPSVFEEEQAVED